MTGQSQHRIRKLPQVLVDKIIHMVEHGMSIDAACELIAATRQLCHLERYDIRPSRNTLVKDRRFHQSPVICAYLEINPK